MYHAKERRSRYLNFVAKNNIADLNYIMYAHVLICLALYIVMGRWPKAIKPFVIVVAFGGIKLPKSRVLFMSCLFDAVITAILYLA